MLKFLLQEAIDVVKEAGSNTSALQAGNNIGANAIFGGTQNVEKLIFYNAGSGVEEGRKLSPWKIKYHPANEARICTKRHRVAFNVKSSRYSQESRSKSTRRDQLLASGRH